MIFQCTLGTCIYISLTSHGHCVILIMCSRHVVSLDPLTSIKFHFKLYNIDIRTPNSHFLRETHSDISI